MANEARNPAEGYTITIRLRGNVWKYEVTGPSGEWIANGWAPDIRETARNAEESIGMAVSNGK